MKLDSPGSSGADTVQGPDVKAEKFIWKIHYELKLRTFPSRVCFASEKDQASIMSGCSMTGCEGRVSNAICTANGGRSARARKADKDPAGSLEYGRAQRSHLGRCRRDT
ncbi:hypothetical protein E3U43_004614 [Larimichthys crocea]|uniref:Uncharacterized protein n=1 Tax=Larimichthys crocea TaxID=215358 RepID=A0ACD3QEP4_LARCR|nr:hypothetical protein E3U43_004614 [Larimichthys crocea]